jgi:hypothetical protein
MSIFKRRRFPVEIILVCVRWYCKYGITYRDLAEMMQERGVEVDASAIFRWVQRTRLSSKSASAGIKATARAPGEWTNLCQGRWTVEVLVPRRRQAWPVDRLHAAGPP